MEKQKELNDSVLAHELRDNILKSLNRSPKDKISDIMDIGSKPLKILWRPNNYRLQINVKPKSNITIENVKSDMGTSVSVGKRNNILFVNFNSNVKLAYGKNNLTAIYSQHVINGVKETFLIEGSPKDVEFFIKNKKCDIEKSLESALFSFARKYNIVKPFQKPVWSRYEDWFKGEEFIDSIPRDVIVHADLFKKVYEEGIEFKNNSKDFEPTENLINYIHNSSLKNNYPELIDELEKVYNIINIKFNGLDFLKNNFRSLNDFNKYLNVIKNLSKEDNELFFLWVFENFSIGGRYYV